MYPKVSAITRNYNKESPHLIGAVSLITRSCLKFCRFLEYGNKKTSVFPTFYALALFRFAKVLNFANNTKPI